jgi:hypothetical protein
LLIFLFASSLLFLAQYLAWYSQPANFRMPENPSGKGSPYVEHGERCFRENLRANKVILDKDNEQ